MMENINGLAGIPSYISRPALEKRAGLLFIMNWGFQRGFPVCLNRRTAHCRSQPRRLNRRTAHCSQPRRLNRRTASLPLALLVSLASSASLHPPLAALSFRTRFASLLRLASSPTGGASATEPSFEIVSPGFADAIALPPPVAEMGRVEAGSETSHASGSEEG